jgi:toxin-antitoxin system PIN domain toxin
VKLIDLNILLYAVNRDSAYHARARAWLERTLTDGEPVALPWTVLLGFLRLSTSPRVFPEPLPSADALAVVDGWLARPAVVPLAPGEGHWSILRDLLAESGAAGNLTTDAHLAALAAEHGAELCSTDADFGRFRGVRWMNPLAAG